MLNKILFLKLFLVPSLALHLLYHSLITIKTFMKKLAYIAAIFCLALTACQDNSGQSKDAATEAADSTATTAAAPAEAAAGTIAQDSIQPPAGFTQLGTASGDLDKDGQNEKVVVYETNRETDMGKERELQIFKQKDNGWELWHKSVGAVLGSEQGGVMGDPFEEVNVENGCVVLAHFGGSREKWHYTHRFRFQDNDWQLIGATVSSGAPCEYFEDFDYNLSTGKIAYKKTTEDCSKSEDNPIEKVTTKDFTVKPKTLPSMDGFQTGANKLTLPKSNIEFYY